MAFLSIVIILLATAGCLTLFMTSPSYGLLAMFAAACLAMILKEPEKPKQDYPTDKTYLSEADSLKHNRYKI